MNRKREEDCHLPEAASPDQVEQAGLDSFPASDPPSWVAVRFGGPPTPATFANVDPSVLPSAALHAETAAGRDCEATTADPEMPDRNPPQPSRRR